MDEDVVRLAVVGHVIRSRWRILAALAVLGALVGAGLSLLLSPGYVASSKVLLLGSRDKEQVASEPQVATSLVVLDRAAASLGWDATGPSLSGDVAAVVAEGNVIEIDGTAASAERARQLTDAVTAQYVAFSGQIVSDSQNAATAATQQHRAELQKQVDDTTTKINDLQRTAVLGAATPEGAQTRAELDQLRNTLSTANAQLDEINQQAQERLQAQDTTKRAGYAVIEPATVRGAAPPTLLQLVGGGALVFAVAGVVGLLVARRLDARLRDPDEIAAALGAPASAVAAVPAARVPAAARARGPRARLRDLLRGDDSRDGDVVAAPADRPYADVRYRRLLERLGGTGARRLVVVPDDDPVAVRAVVLLAVATAAQGPAVTVEVDEGRVENVTELLDGADAVDVVPADAAGPAADRAVFRLVEVAPGRPDVPGPGGPGPSTPALVVVSVGTRTGWELVGIAGACGDAGHPVGGVLVVCPTRSGAPRPPADEEPDPAEPPAGTSMMAGSA